MLVDFRSCGKETLTADVCIVGSGAAGLTLAALLRRMGISVLLLESGGSEEAVDTAALSEGTVMGPTFTGLLSGRARLLGGTTKLWSGGCIRLEESAFQQRGWVRWSGWPFPREELIPHYENAERLLKVTDRQTRREASAKPLSGLDPSVLKPDAASFCPEPDFSRLFQDDLKSTNMVVALHGTVTRICLAPDAGRVEALEVRSSSGSAALVRARAFVLCAGAVENARLMLASRDVAASGVGNQNDLVGRFFQDHPTADIATIENPAKAQLRAAFAQRVRGGKVIWPRLELSPDLQRREHVLNAYAYALPMREAFSLVPTSLGAASTRRRSDAPTHPAKPPVKWRVRVRSLFPRPIHAAEQFIFRAVAEQAPNPASRVSLGDKLDRHSVPLPHVSWSVSALERKTFQLICQAADQEFGRLGLGKVISTPALASEDFSDTVCDTFHHAGTTRMSDDARQGVVDANCRVHGVGNLYIGGASVFPICGAANPTLTIVALASRLSEHISGSLRSS